MNLEETLDFIHQANEETLFVLWTNPNPIVANEMVFMYTENAKKFSNWEEIMIIVWGATTKLIAEDKQLQERILRMKQLGIRFSACVTCAEDLGVADKIGELGIDLVKWRMPLTDILKGNKKLITI